MRVEQIMSRPAHACREDDPLSAAARQMWDGDFGCIPVVNEREVVVAMLTDRDVCMAAYTQGRTLHEIPVSTAMSHRLIACGPRDSISRAHEIMREHRIRRLPVVDAKGHLIGVISLSDVARAAAGSDELIETAKILAVIDRPRIAHELVEAYPRVA